MRMAPTPRIRSKFQSLFFNQEVITAELCLNILEALLGCFMVRISMSETDGLWTSCTSEILPVVMREAGDLLMFFNAISIVSNLVLKIFAPIFQEEGRWTGREVAYIIYRGAFIGFRLAGIVMISGKYSFSLP